MTVPNTINLNRNRYTPTDQELLRHEVNFRLSKLTAKTAAGGRGFVDRDLEKSGQMGFDPPPEPRAHFLNGRAFQALDVVEITVIHQIDQRIHRFGNALVIINPADAFIDHAFDGHQNLEAMTVHAPAFVSLRQARQGVRSLKSEFLG